MIGRKKTSVGKKIKRVAIGGTVAAAAGYVAGVLTAPKSGQETRQDIKKAANRTRSEAEKDLKKAQTEIDKAVSEAKATGTKTSAKAKKELNDLVDKAKDTKQKASELLTAVQKGKAKDKDLNKAVKDAKMAVKHLRDYLKK